MKTRREQLPAAEASSEDLRHPSSYERPFGRGGEFVQEDSSSFYLDDVASDFVPVTEYH